MINLLCFFQRSPRRLSLNIVYTGYISGCYDKVLTLKATGKIDHTYYYEKMDQFMSVPEKGKDVSALCCGE
jgi:hypothetical protein